MGQSISKETIFQGLSGPIKSCVQNSKLDQVQSQCLMRAPEQRRRKFSQGKRDGEGQP